MGEAADLISRRVTLRQASKLAKRNERFIKTKLIDGGHLRAWREGSATRPRFFVLPDEIPAAILAAGEYIPPAPNVKRARATPRASVATHADVRF